MINLLQKTPKKKKSTLKNQQKIQWLLIFFEEYFERKLQRMKINIQINHRSWWQELHCRHKKIYLHNLK